MLNDQHLFINLRDTKNYKPRDFTVVETTARIIREYMELRPPNTSHKRFFVNYHKGRCTKQPIGINKFSKIASTIARYLRLPNPEEYSVHSFRTIATTLIVQAGVSLLQLEQIRGPKSISTAENYIQNDESNLISNDEEEVVPVRLLIYEPVADDTPGTSKYIIGG